MKRLRPGVGSELLPVALILLGLAGTLALIIATHQRAEIARRTAATAPPVVVAPPPPPKPAEPAPQPSPPVPVVVEAEPEPEPEPPAPAEDPTKKALARAVAQVEENRQAARAADRRAAAYEVARKAAEARTQEWRRREALVKAQVEQIEQKASALEAEADALAMDRDVLARERDAAKAALAKATAKGGGWAVLPHKNANGTWQRPVVVECRDGTATLQPNGPTVSLVQMSPMMGPRSNPLVVAVARELIRVHRSASPDGESVVPYIFFIVRPDGIRPYYEARARLEPLGIAFGYELVDQDMEIDFPDLDALATWDGSNVPGAPGGPGAGGNAVARNDPAEFVWPADRPGGVQKERKRRPRANAPRITSGPPARIREPATRTAAPRSLSARAANRPAIASSTPAPAGRLPRWASFHQAVSCATALRRSRTSTAEEPAATGSPAHASSLQGAAERAETAATEPAVNSLSAARELVLREAARPEMAARDSVPTPRPADLFRSSLACFPVSTRPALEPEARAVRSRMGRSVSTPAGREPMEQGEAPLAPEVSQLSRQEARRLLDRGAWQMHPSRTRRAA